MVQGLNSCHPVETPMEFQALGSGMTTSGFRKYLIVNQKTENTYFLAIQVHEK